jgi:hypothetical protein
VVAAVAAAGDADPGRRQRAVLAFELGEALVAAVAGVDVKHQQAGRDAGADVGRWPAGPPALHPGRVAGGGVQAVAELVPALASGVGLVAGRAGLAGRAVAVGQLAAQREHLVAGRRVGQRRLPQPGHGRNIASGSSRRAWYGSGRLDQMTSVATAPRLPKTFEVGRCTARSSRLQRVYSSSYSALG